VGDSVETACDQGIGEPREIPDATIEARHTPLEHGVGLGAVHPRRLAGLAARIHQRRGIFVERAADRGEAVVGVALADGAEHRAHRFAPRPVPDPVEHRDVLRAWLGRAGGDHPESRHREARDRIGEPTDAAHRIAAEIGDERPHGGEAPLGIGGDAP